MTKAEAFNSGRVDRYPVDPDFIWQTQEGELLHPTEMSVFHLYHSLRMIWNHTVPVEYRFLPYKPYNYRAGRLQRKRAVANLFSELMNRPNRPKYMDDCLAVMAHYIIMSERKKL